MRRRAFWCPNNRLSSQPISSAVTFAPLVQLPVVVTVSVRTAAWVLQRTQWGWGHACGYRVIASLVTMAGMLTAPRAIGAAPGFQAISLLAALGLGGGYLGPLSQPSEGAPVRFKDRVQVCRIRWLLLCTLPVAIVFAGVRVL